MPVKYKIVSDAMETDDPGPSKRARVDVDPDTGAPIAGSGNAKYNPDKETKIKVLWTLARLLNDVAEKLGLGGAKRVLNVMDQIMNNLFTAHHYLRQEAAGKMNEKGGDTPYLVNYDRKYTIARIELNTMVKHYFEEVGLAYTANAKWISVGNPMFSLLTGFNMRRDELRIGHSRIVLGKEIKDDKSVPVVAPVSKFGLGPQHGVLLEGVTYPPEKRSALAQSLGPLTSVIWLTKTPGIYGNKWADSVKKAFQHYPEIDSVINHLKGANSSVIAQLVRLLADLALMAGTRASCKGFIPPAAFAAIILKDTPVLVPQEGVAEVQIKPGPILKGLDASGLGFFRFYKMFQSQKWTLLGGAGLDEVRAQEITYHSMFGTYKEDLGILSQITDHANWLRRNDLNSSFAKAGTVQKKVKFTPINQKYFSKLVQANQSEFFANTQKQMSSQGVFSGSTSRPVSADFGKNLACNQDSVNAAMSLQDLLANYRYYCAAIYKKIERDGLRIRYGKLNWGVVSTINNENDQYEEYDAEIEGNGQFFLQPREEI